MKDTELDLEGVQDIRIYDDMGYYWKEVEEEYNK